MSKPFHPPTWRRYRPRDQTVPSDSRSVTRPSEDLPGVLPTELPLPLGGGADSNGRPPVSSCWCYLRYSSGMYPAITASSTHSRKDHSLPTSAGFK